MGGSTGAGGNRHDHPAKGRHDEALANGKGRLFLTATGKDQGECHKDGHAGGHHKDLPIRITLRQINAHGDQHTKCQCQQQQADDEINGPQIKLHLTFKGLVN